MGSDERLFAKIFVIFLLALALLAPAAAQENDRSGSVIILENETGPINAFGGTVTVTGPIDGALSVFAGDVSIQDTISGDVQAFAGNTRISSDIAGELSAFTGNLVLTENSSIGNGLQAFAGNVVLEGDVQGNSTINAENIYIGPNATINGSLNYSAENFTNQGTVTGQIIEQEEFDQGFEYEPFNIEPVSVLFSFLSRLVIGAFLLLVIPKFSREISESFRDETGRSTLFGIITLVMAPILLFIALITIIGIPLAIIGLIVYLITLWIATIYGSYAVGEMAFEGRKWIALVSGLVLWEILGIIPILGWFIQFVIFLIGLGAIMVPLWERYS